MMQRDEIGIQRLLERHWGEVCAALQQLNGSAMVRPNNISDIFRKGSDVSDTGVTFDFGPVCFNLPERGDDSTMGLFVAVTGVITFQRGIYTTTGDLSTDCFTTRVAYFRRKGAQVKHIFGAHYDFALNELGHPIFHAQIRSNAGMWAYIATQFRLADVAEGDDCVKGVLQGVRLPTAQMDLFSVCLQLFADHLLFKNSGKRQKKAFNDLIGKSVAVQGAGFQAPRLSTAAAYTCLRAPHWYPVMA